MPSMEQVDKLRAYADISIEEARDVLVEAGGDLLEAVILLEKRGKVKPPSSGGYTSERDTSSRQETPPRPEYAPPKKEGESFSQMIGRFCRWLGRVIHKGNSNTLEVNRYDKHILSLPVTALVLLLIFAFWCVVPLLIIGLFFEFRYSFKGPDMGRDQVNDAMNSVAGAAERLKKEVKDTAEQNHERNNSDR